MSVKRIGVLTSGGDAPGMNACVRAVVRTAMYHGIECYGIRRGYNGLITGDIIKLDEKNISHIINRGGTILYTARSKDFLNEEGQKKAVSTCKFLGLDSIVAIGGDGTFRGAKALSKWGINVVCIPATIDNILAFIGEQFNVSRVYIFENNDDDTACSNTFEWCQTSVSAEIRNLQDLPLHKFSDLIWRLETEGAFFIHSIYDDLDSASEEFRILESKGAVSLMAAPLMHGSQIVGYIAVNDPRRNEGNLTLLQSVSSFVLAELVLSASESLERVEAILETALPEIGSRMDSFVMARYTNTSTRQPAPNPAQTIPGLPSESIG